MSAADLFRDCHDVDFRLRSTNIMIGRDPYYVMACSPSISNHAKNTELYLESPKGEELRVLLGRLPLRAMTDCPSGYYNDFWWTRGPARHRYQGITGSSLWAVMANGSIETGGVSNCRTALKTLALQPKTRRVGKRPSGILTRDVMIDPSGRVLIRGRLRGEYLGENKIKPLTELSPLSKQLLTNAKLFLNEQDQDQPQLSPEPEMDELKMEVIL